MTGTITPEIHAEHITDLVREIANYALRHRIPFDIATKPGVGQVYERITLQVDIPVDVPVTIKQETTA